MIVTLATLPAASVLFLRPPDASAAACASDLTVAGMKVTGDDCVTQGDGSIRIRNPRLATSGAVRILDNGGGNVDLILNSARTELKPEPDAFVIAG